jgi:hypothetical protein
VVVDEPAGHEIRQHLRQKQPRLMALPFPLCPAPPMPMSMLSVLALRFRDEDREMSEQSLLQICRTADAAKRRHHRYTESKAVAVDSNHPTDVETDSCIHTIREGPAMAAAVLDTVNNSYHKYCHTY